MATTMYIEKQISALLREMNGYRAMLADAEMKEAIFGRATPEQIAKRAYRRRKERERNAIVPPGPWDEDLDNYPELSYTVDLGDGYTGKISRSMFMTWNGYVTVPNEDHWSVGKALTSSYWEYPGCPATITYHERLTVGFDHCNGYDVYPYDPVPELSRRNYWMPQVPKENEYITYEKAMEEVKALAEFLKKDPRTPAPRRSWAQVAAAGNK